jgi:predicted nucleic acid-binding protein
MSDILVLDTNTFLGILAGFDTEGRVYSKIIRICDKVGIGEKLLEEYHDTLKKKLPTLVGYRIDLRLQDLAQLNKLRKPPTVTQTATDIDPRDRHVIDTATSLGAKYVVTHDHRDLLDHRDRIRARYHVEVIEPESYLQMPDPSP